MANKFVRGPLWTTMMTAFIAVLVALFVFLQSGESAQAVDEQRYETQIIGGTAVPDGKYEFVAALYDNSVGPPFCGGALIDTDSVLTAAHCVYGYSPAPLRVHGRADGARQQPGPDAPRLQDLRPSTLQRNHDR